MLRKLLLPISLLVVNFFTFATQASPIDAAQEANLVLRDNHAALRCSNSPSVIAGVLWTNSKDWRQATAKLHSTSADYQQSYADQEHSVLQTSLPPSGSDYPWVKYLWCTLGTRTYTDFEYGHIDAMPPGYFSVYQAFVQAAIDVNNHIVANGDSPIDSTGWYFAPLNTKVELWVQSKVGTMTWGVLGAALRGLSTAANNYNSANAPMIFQINDGHNGEMGSATLVFLPHSLAAVVENVSMLRKTM